MSSKMAQTSSILASIDIGEAHRPRAARLAKAIASDEHFVLGKVANLSHDIRFQWMDRIINVELKDFSLDGQSDYVGLDCQFRGPALSTGLKGSGDGGSFRNRSFRRG